MDENNLNAKNQQKGLIIGGIVLILLIAIGIGAYMLLPMKPKEVFTTAIDKVYKASKNNSQQQNTIGANFTLNMDIHSEKEEEEKILEVLNNLDLRYEIAMNNEEKRAHILLDTNYKEKELINATIDIQEENAYVFLKDIYSKNLIIPVEGFNEMFSIMEKQKEYETILKHLKNALEKALKEEYFSKENTTITLNNKKTKVVKNSLLLDEKNSSEMISTLAEELNNDEFISSLANLQNVSEEEVKEMITEIKENEITLKDPITISIYTKGKSFVGLEVNGKTATISILKDTDTNYTYEIKLDNESYKGNIEIAKKEKNIHLKATFDVESIQGSITMDFDYNENVNLPEIDTNNSISIEKLSEKEQKEILENLQKKEGIALLIQTVFSFQTLNF